MAEAATIPLDRPWQGSEALARDNPLLARAQQEVKSAVHRELINKIDLEKLLFMQDTRGKPATARLNPAAGRRIRRALQRQRAYPAGQRGDG